MSKRNARRLRQDGIERIWEQYARDAKAIADVYEVSLKTVYDMLRIHCINTKQDYRSFLRVPHKPHVLKNKRVMKDVRLMKTTPKKKFRIKPKFHEEGKVDSDIDFILGILRECTADDIDDIIECTQMLLATIDKLRGEYKNA